MCITNIEFEKNEAFTSSNVNSIIVAIEPNKTNT
jgi:hypothetical protein